MKTDFFSFELVRNAVDTGWLVLSKDTRQYVAVVCKENRPGRHWQWKPLNEGTNHDWHTSYVDANKIKCSKCGIVQGYHTAWCSGSGFVGDFRTVEDAAMAALDELLDGSSETESSDDYAEACLNALRGTG